MKHSEIKEMIRRIVRERKLTKAEEKKKEDIVKGMKKSFKGDKASMYAIATAKAKKIAEADDSIKVNQPDYKGTIRKVEGGYQLYDVNGNVEDKEVGPFKTMSSLMSYYDISMDQLNEAKGTELTSKIFDIGSTLKKVEAAMDFGMDQDPQIIKGLDQVYDELINVLALIEKDREENKFVNEDIDIGHQDDEPGMLKNELARTAKMAAMLYKKIKAYGDTGAEIDFPQWWQSNIIKAKDYLQGAFDYLDGEESVAKIDATMDALKFEEKDPLDVVVAEKKGKDLDGDGDVDSEDYLKARDIAIKKAQAKKK